MGLHLTIYFTTAKLRLVYLYEPQCRLRFFVNNFVFLIRGFIPGSPVFSPSAKPTLNSAQSDQTH